MSIADWVQIGGLAINGGLLAGLIVQIHLSTKTRRADLTINRQQATLDAWSVLVNSIREAETSTRTFFGRGQLSRDLAIDFLRSVSMASGRRAAGSSEFEKEDVAIISANEALRSLLNTAEDFAIGTDLGAYDVKTARRVGGWRLSRLVNRHLEYIELIREDVEEDGIYRTLQDFVDEFLATQGKKIQDIRMLTGHGYAPGTAVPASPNPSP